MPAPGHHSPTRGRVDGGAYATRYERMRAVRPAGAWTAVNRDSLDLVFAPVARLLARLGPEQV